MFEAAAATGANAPTHRRTPLSQMAAKLPRPYRARPTCNSLVRVSDRASLAFRGLHDALRHTFYPEYEFGQVKKKKKQEKEEKQRKTQAMQGDTFVGLGDFSLTPIASTLDLADGPASKRRAPSTMPRGRGGGRLVDHLMNTLVNGGDVTRVGQTRARKSNTPLRYVVSESELAQLNRRPAVWCISREQAQCLPPACRAYVLDLLKQNYFPVAAQLVVACEHLGWWTRAEQLWANPDTGHWAYIELDKSEPGLYRESGGAHLSGPLSDVDSTPEHHKQLQLAFSVWMAERTLGVRFKDAWVARVGASSHELLPLASWVRDRMPAVLHHAATTPMPAPVSSASTSMSATGDRKKRKRTKKQALSTRSLESASAHSDSLEDSQQQQQQQQQQQEEDEEQEDEEDEDEEDEDEEEEHDN